jgi:hypothetical protein
MKFKAYAFHRLSRKLCLASLWFSKVCYFSRISRVWRQGDEAQHNTRVEALDGLVVYFLPPDHQ